MTEGTARIVTIASIVLTVGSVLLAVRLAGRRRRIRTGFDVARSVITVGSIIVMAVVAGLSAPAAAVVMAIAAGFTLGYVQGSNLEVTTGDRGALYGRRTTAGIALWGAGVVVVQAAGLANRSGWVQAGQSIAWFSAFLGVGLLVGRDRSVREARRTVAGAGVAVLIMAFALPLLMMAPAPALQGTSRWELAETLVNPDGEPTEFVVGVTPNFYESPRFDGTSNIYTVAPSLLTASYRWVEREYESYDVTLAFSVEPPPTVLEPGETVVLAASGTATGSYRDNANPFAQFEFWVEGADLEGESWMAVGINPTLAQTSASVSPTFEVPAPRDEDDELVIIAGLWNCAACRVEWVYEPVMAAPATTEPATTVTTATTIPTATTTGTGGGTDTTGGTDGSDAGTDTTVGSGTTGSTAPGGGDVDTSGTAAVPPSSSDDSDDLTPEEAVAQAIAGVIAAVAIGAITSAEAAEAIAAILGGGSADTGSSGTELPPEGDGAVAAAPPPEEPSATERSLDPCAPQEDNYEEALEEWQELQAEVEALRSQYRAVELQWLRERETAFAGAAFDVAALGADVYLGATQPPPPDAVTEFFETAARNFGRSIVKQAIQGAVSGETPDLDSFTNQTVEDITGLQSAEAGRPTGGLVGSYFNKAVTALVAEFRTDRALRNFLAKPGRSITDPAMLSRLERRWQAKFAKQAGPIVGVISKYADFWHKNQQWGLGVEDRKRRLLDELTRIGTEIGELEYDLGEAADAVRTFGRFLDDCRREMGR